MAESDDYNPMADFIRMQEEFGEAFDGTEMVFHERGLGMHTLYDTYADDPTIGFMTAFYGAINDAVEEVRIDADTLEIRQGEVSPEAPREELKNQLYDHISWHDLEEEILDAVASHVERRQGRWRRCRVSERSACSVKASAIRQVRIGHALRVAATATKRAVLEMGGASDAE